ncbi:polysaccharide biosynthesis tyrosine autokinase [Microbacterium mangrovi]|uniref:polysaccharide biosynthesis tyrosine autokinase n=1 Tax=Microbacterium mangrovi TaxID=1348253 RepID=UPI000691054D|nr:polysaccharide biosynthesis tyrosine autokinase [Microbacterium mangrovi]
MELRDYLRGLRRYWLAVVLMTIAGVAFAAGWAAMQKPVYAATASAFISTPANAKNAATVVGQGMSVPTGYVASFTEYAAWKSTAQGAINALHLSATPGDVAGRVTVTSTPDTAILSITATGDTPAEAENLANAWVTGLHKTIDKVQGTGTAGSAPMNVYLGNPAEASPIPVSPDWKTALLVGGVIGLGFGIAFALTRTASDRRIRAGEEVTGKLGHPVVGTIPERPVDGKKRRGADTSFAFDESMRVLRTNLQFMDVDNPPRVIVVTSPVPGDGKSTVAVELAKALAASGAPTVLVDGDLRRPTVAKKLGLPAGAGLSDVLAGRAVVTELLHRVTGISNMLVLTAGTVPPNPSEILGSERMHGLMSYLSTEATVIVDAPPLLPVTDGAVLAHQADGALLVVSAGKTTFDLAGKALEALENARGRALGIVINRAPIRGADASPYSYAYYTYYSQDGTPATPAAATTQAAEEADMPLDADDPFLESLHRAAGGESAPAAEVPDTAELDLRDVMTPLLDDGDLTPRTTRDRSRRS